MSEQFFTVLRLCREDVYAALGIDLYASDLDISDEQMEYIAGKVGDAFIELGWWDVVAEVAEHVLGLEKD